MIPRLVQGNVFAGLADDGDEFTFEVDVVASQFNVGVGGSSRARFPPAADSGAIFKILGLAEVPLCRPSPIVGRV